MEKTKFKKFVTYVRILGCTILLFSCISGLTRAESIPIIMDGFFDDWDATPYLASDPVGDGGSSGIDFGKIWVANDDRFLFLRIEVGREWLLESWSNITLYIDADNDPSTGYKTGNIGADLQWNFSDRDGKFYYPGGSMYIEHEDIHLRALPTTTWDQFEIAISREMKPDGSHYIFTNDTLSIYFRDTGSKGDWAPDQGSPLRYIFDSTTLGKPETILLAKDNPEDVRLITYNVLQDGLFERTSYFERILKALNPDIIAFQEIYDHDADETRALIEGILPGTWYAAYGIADKRLLSRYPIYYWSWSIAGGRAVATKVEPFSKFSNGMLLINCHLTSGSGDEERQQQVDQIMAFIRQAQQPGGDPELEENTPIIICGDMNFVGYYRQVETLLTGDIENNASYGKDFVPDWDGTDLKDLVSRQPQKNMCYTWYSKSSSYYPGRIDYIIYTDSAIDVHNHFILHTPELDPAYLSDAGLNKNDTKNASDHLPHVADLSPASHGVNGNVKPSDAGKFSLHNYPNPFNPMTTVSFSLTREESVSLDIYDISGSMVRNLFKGRCEQGLHNFIWNGTSSSGAQVASGCYIYTLKIRDAIISGKCVLVK